MTQLTDLMFASEDAILRGKLYAPDDAARPGKAPLGVVVMAHGFSAVAAQLEPQARRRGSRPSSTTIRASASPAAFRAKRSIRSGRFAATATR